MDVGKEYLLKGLQLCESLLPEETSQLQTLKESYRHALKTEEKLLGRKF